MLVTGGGYGGCRVVGDLCGHCKGFHTTAHIFRSGHFLCAVWVTSGIVRAL